MLRPHPSSAFALGKPQDYLSSFRANADRLIRCSTYSYEYHADVLSKLDADVLQARYAELIPLLKEFDLYPRKEGVPSYEVFLAEYYTALASNSRAGLREAQLSLRDRTWELLADALTTPRSKVISMTRPSSSSSSSPSFSPSFSSSSSSAGDDAPSTVPLTASSSLSYGRPNLYPSVPSLSYDEKAVNKTTTRSDGGKPGSVCLNPYTAERLSKIIEVPA